MPNYGMENTPYVKKESLIANTFSKGKEKGLKGHDLGAQEQKG